MRGDERVPTGAQIRRVQRLARRKDRQSTGRFLAEGVRVVSDLLDSELVVTEAYVAPGLEAVVGGLELGERLASAAPVYRVTDSVLAELAATETPQGVVAVAETPERRLEALEVPGAGVVLVLDGVQDPGNLGTLVRTAEALGAAFVVTLPGTVDPWNPKSVRAAAGSLFRIPVAAAGFSELLEWLRAGEFTVYGAEAQGEPADRLRPFPRRAALVVGNEGAGLSEAVRASADALIAVPLRGRAESLNVAAAAAILLFLLRGE